MKKIKQCIGIGNYVVCINIRQKWWKYAVYDNYCKASFLFWCPESKSSGSMPPIMNFIGGPHGRAEFLVGSMAPWPTLGTTPAGCKLKHKFYLTKFYACKTAASHFSHKFTCSYTQIVLSQYLILTLSHS